MCISQLTHMVSSLQCNIYMKQKSLELHVNLSQYITAFRFSYKQKVAASKELKSALYRVFLFSLWG